jgi:7,8-dihydropterin-6-yl-methyl-4-(beta-D-ribofuranosyl)aminobenzene 5'-phosphate synthase
MNITIVFDNNVINKRFISGHGFSCLIQSKQINVLFDTGSDSSILLNNMNRLNINPKSIDSIVLSHEHDDHIDGLTGFLEHNIALSVYLLKSFIGNYKDKVRSLGVNVEEVEEPKEIFSGIYTTGELGSDIKEQSLIIDTNNGLVIVTGCAHPGVIKIIRKSIEMIPRKKIYLVMGGFHLSWAPVREIKQILVDSLKLGVKKLVPCHCTGGEAYLQFKQRYLEDCVQGCVGKIINFQSHRENNNYQDKGR